MNLQSDLKWLQIEGLALPLCCGLHQAVLSDWLTERLVNVESRNTDILEDGRFSFHGSDVTLSKQYDGGQGAGLLNWESHGEFQTVGDHSEGALEH